MNGRAKTKLWNMCVLALNIILIIGLVVSFFLFDNGYKQKIYGQNIDEISNINQASASISSTFFSGREAKLRDLALHIENEKLNLEQCLDFIYSSNSDSNKAFEIIGEDFRGYRVEKDKDGKYIPIDYTSGYGSICSMFQKNITQNDSQIIGFASEFTDGYNAKKSFALYNCLHLRGNNGEIVPYTLMVVSVSADFIDMININSGYDKLATTIISRDGDYIIGNSEFKSDNFFKYLALFNDWTLDRRNEVETTVNDNLKGMIACLDGRSRESVFVYTPVPNKDWYCVTTVQEKNFRNSATEYSFSLIVIAIMLLLMTVDILYLFVLNRRLKVSAEKERIASAAKTDFLSRMSHDMRTPMNGIIGMTRLTQDISDLPAEAQENLKDISDSSAYLLQLINDTLDMSKIESNKFTLNPETVNSDELIKNIITVIKPIADQKNIKMEFEAINSKLEYIHADRMRVQQIFMNILSNAVKFTPENGTIRTEVECLSRDDKILHDRISVEDTGCGMSEEYLEHIFEPFSQEKTRIVRGQEGTGLGMAIVKNLVELMGGTIEIQSKVGSGTKITIYIDFAIDHPTDISENTGSSDKTSLAGKRVLLVEDHPMNANIAKRLLMKKDMLIEHAENGAIAVKMFSESAEEYYDIVLMDIRMPEMGGLEATRRIRALEREDAKKIPILAMTANAYAEDIQAALSAGMNAHLAKPIEPNILYSAISKYI